VKNWYEHYFKQVLGVQHLMRPQSHAKQASETSRPGSLHQALRVLFVGSEKLPAVERELLQKIFQAVQIDSSAKKLMFFSPADEKLFLEQVFIAQDVVCFDQEMAQYLRSHLSDLSIIQLESLRELIAAPEKKKMVWSQLKSLMENKWSVK
jgi:hypothetical protein